MNINKDDLFYAGLLTVIVVGFFGLCSNKFLDRRHFEEINNRYEICLEYSEIASVCSIENISEINALALFRTAGVTAISFFPD